LTFFPWEHAAPGRAGTGDTSETAYRIPKGSAEWWHRHLAEHGVETVREPERFGETVLSLRDPDGMRLALIAADSAVDKPAWTTSAVPEEHAIRGFAGVTLMLGDTAPTAAVLTDVLGFSADAQDGSTLRLRANGTSPGGVVDLRQVAGIGRAQMGRGSVHHVAFRAADDAAQSAMAERLYTEHGIATTEQKDRCYFRSVYFREPGGVIFEIATDAPGFAVDEPEATLGTSLKLPAFLEPRRARIETALPALG
ncbi:MAG TPA: ring-cleaving dioxygenase, partial [Rhodopila sp.]